MQENAFRFCNIDYISFWRYTPAETTKMIIIAAEKESQAREFTASLEARLCAIVLNANGVTKKNKELFDVEDFMPKKTSKKSAEKTVEQLEQMAKFAAMRMGGSVIDRVG